jgi:hypothetical protein
MLKDEARGVKAKGGLATVGGAKDCGEVAGRIGGAGILPASKAFKGMQDARPPDPRVTSPQRIATPAAG